MSSHTTNVLYDLRRAIDRAIADATAVFCDRDASNLLAGPGHRSAYWRSPHDRLTVGDLRDDVETMDGYLSSGERSPAVWHELNQLVGVLCAAEVHALFAPVTEHPADSTPRQGHRRPRCAMGCAHP